MKHILYSLLLIGLSGCASQWASQQDSYAGDDGSTVAVIEITSSPTSAWIFIDGVYVGTTPIEMEMSFGAGTSYLEVAAVPIHDSQSRQVKRIKVPPLPKSLHFLMNNSPEQDQAAPTVQQIGSWIFAPGTHHPLPMPGQSTCCGMQ